MVHMTMNNAGLSGIFMGFNQQDGAPPQVMFVGL